VSAPKHAADVAHPHLTNVYQLAGDLVVLAGVGLKFMWVHMFGLLMLLVSSTFVTVLTFSFVIAGLPVVGVFVLLFGTMALGCVLAIKAMGKEQ
jgi:hypothetical protein